MSKTSEDSLFAHRSCIMGVKEPAKVLIGGAMMDANARVFKY